MKRHRRLWTLLAVVGLAGGMLWSGAAQTLARQFLDQKPTECDSCPLGSPAPAAGSQFAVLKHHGNPRERLIPEDQLLAVSGLSPASKDGYVGGKASAAGTGDAANVFVNDPCLDPSPNAPDRFNRTLQSETEIAVLNHVKKGDDDDDDDDGDDDDDEDE